MDVAIPHPAIKQARCVCFFFIKKYKKAPRRWREALALRGGLRLFYLNKVQNLLGRRARSRFNNTKKATKNNSGKKE
jgi:hypothetical protein